jgi:hypothetical protein
MIRSVRITTTTHAMAITGYFVLIVFSIAFAVGATAVRSIATFLPFPIEFWAIAFMLGALSSMVASLIAPRLSDPTHALTAEMVGCALTSVCIALYEVALIRAIGATALATQILVSGLALGAALRAIQILHERHMIKKARHAPDDHDHR